MKQTVITCLLVCAFILAGGISLAQSIDKADGSVANAAAPQTLPRHSSPSGLAFSPLLYDNGPLVNAPGAGPNGTDGSVLQSSLGLSILGFGVSAAGGTRIADDFPVMFPGWQIDSISVYGYQTGADTASPSTITGITLRIWNGPPDSASSAVVWGDSLSNIIASSYWQRAVRYSENSVGATRPVMRVTANVGVVLPPGHYWADWQLSGSLASGPWAPPITITGDTATGNGFQCIAGVYNPTLDNGKPQGFPLMVFGTPHWPANLLYQNGPLVNAPGLGPNRSHGSVVQNLTLGLGTTGWTVSTAGGFRLAEEFAAGPTDWRIDSVSVFAYQTGADTAQPSTLTAMTVRIWNGPPNDPASTVVWGDSLTNVLASSYWERVFRYSETSINTSRPVMRATAFIGRVVSPGGYWVDWQLTGSLASGPFAPPVTITGDSLTGNALQQATSTGAWSILRDNFVVGREQGIPIEIFGEILATNVNRDGSGPATFALEQNYPNPFNPSTLIRYSVAENRGNGGGSMDVRLVVYDLLGREVAVLVNGRKPAGNHEVTFNAGGLSSGIYIYRLTTGQFVTSRRMMLLK